MRIASSPCRLLARIPTALLVAAALWSSLPSKALAGGLRDVRDVTLGEPIDLEGARLYPLVAREGTGGGPRTPLTVSRAYRTGRARLEEHRDGRVTIANTGTEAIYVPAGQILRGGSQDRIVVYDAVVAASGEPDTLWTLCAEKGRSTARPGGNRLEARDELASPRVRMAAGVFQSQPLVWAEIERALDAAGLRSATHAYPRSQPWRDAWLARSARRIRQALEPSADVVGLALAVDGSLRSVDLLGTPELFASLEEAIINAYALETRVWLDLMPKPRPSKINGFDLQQFVLGWQAMGPARRVSGGSIQLVAGRAQSIGTECRLSGGTLVRISMFSGRPKTGGLTLKDVEDTKRRRTRQEQTGRPELRPPPPGVTDRYGRGRTTPRPKPVPPRGGGGGD